MINNESGEIELTGSVVARDLAHFLIIELDTANRALQGFGEPLQLTETGELDPPEKGLAQDVCQAFTGGAQGYIKECKEALKDLSQGKKGLAYGLLERRIKSLTKEVNRASLGGRTFESSNAWQQVEALKELREK